MLAAMSMKGKHHVEVSAHIYADKTAIHVMSVQMLKEAN
jgi:hypothetical protein